MQVGIAQTTNFKHNYLLENVTDESQLAISLAKSSATYNYIQAQGLQVKHISPNWIFLTINGKQLKDLLNSPIASALYTEISEPVAMNDTSRARHQVNEVHKGLQGLQQKFTGKGIILGFVDTGLDFKHPDFKDSLGKTRVYSYWDQTKTTSTPTSPQPYNYGENWTASDIDNGLCTATDNVGHGTHVVGIAAGNGKANGKNMGMAPEATIVFVQTNNAAKNWTLTVSDACDYIFKIADQLGKPCVINISYGVAMGSHDGNDPASELIEGMLDAKPGRIVVAAAGNNGNLGKYHVHGNVTTDTSFFWVKSTSKGIAGTNSILLEMWADSLAFKDVQFATGANLPSSNYALRGKTKFRTFAEAFTFAPNALRDTIFNENGVKLAYVDYYAEMINHECHMQTAYTKIDSTNYLFQFMSTGSGSYDVWSGSANKVGTKNFNDFETVNIPSTSVYPPIAHYLMADTLQTIFSSYISSEKVMTVGNVSNKASYTTKDGVMHTSVYQPGEIHASSSKGPNRKGVTKPDIMASGTKIFSANPMNFLSNPANYPNMDVDGYHILNSGTSMASPLVAGVAALYLEKCSNATYSDFKSDVIATAKTYPIQGSIPNSAYGNGEINALSLLLKTNAKTSFSGSSEISCLAPASITIVSDRGINSLTWNDADMNISKNFTQAGRYSYQIQDGKNCTFRDTITITKATNPIVSLKTIGGQTITCSNNTVQVVATGGVSYQWSGGKDVTNDTNTFDQAGTYKVTVTNSKGCTTIDSIHISNDTLTPKLTFHFIAGQKITCTNKSVKIKVDGAQNYVWDDGITPTKDTNTFAKAGYFHVTGTGVNGCSQKDSVRVLMDTVRPNASVQFIGSDTLTCTHTQVNVIVSGGASYLWFNGNQPTSNANSFTDAGTYAVQITGTNGCQQLKNITVYQDTASPVLSLVFPNGTTLNCSKTSLTVFGSGAAFYQWNGGQNQNAPTNTFTLGGKYKVTGFGTNGCTSEKTFQLISDTAKPIVKLSYQGDSILNCVNKSVKVVMLGGSQYAWNGGTKFTSNIQEFFKEGVYQLHTIGFNTCSSTQNLSIKSDTIVPTLTKSFLTDSSFSCKNKNVTINLKGADNYQWDGGSSPLQAINSFQAPGIYHLVASGKNGCTLEDSITLSGDTLPLKTNVQIIGNKSLTCSAKRVKALASGGISYNWSGGNSILSDTNSFTFPGNYLVDIIDIKGCKSTQTVYISQDISLPTISINYLSSPYITCDNDPVRVQVTGAKTYTWDGGKYTTLDSNVFVTTGTYHVEGIDAKGCKNSETIIVDKHSYPASPVIQQKDSILICSTSPNYQWYLNGELLPNDTLNSIKYMLNGTYFVSTHNQGCIATSKFFTPTASGMEEQSLPEVQLFPNPTTTNTIHMDGLMDDDVLFCHDILGNNITLQRNQTNEIHFETLAEGMYFITIERKSTKVLVKFTKI
jgi:subtilisin family serine protease